MTVKHRDCDSGEIMEVDTDTIDIELEMGDPCPTQRFIPWRTRTLRLGS